MHAITHVNKFMHVKNFFFFYAISLDQVVDVRVREGESKYTQNTV